MNRPANREQTVGYLLRRDLCADADTTQGRTRRRTALFRIFQETLTNIVRHAEATRVAVRLQDDDGQLILQVTDNGKGIEPCQISDSKSLGLLGIKERVMPWGGEVDIQATDPQGTSVTVRVQAETP